MATAVEQIVAAHPYQDSDVILVPYNEKSFPEDFLPRTYLKLKKDGVLGRVFHCNPGVTLNQFVASLYEKPIIVACDKSKNPYEVIGIGWLYEVTGRPGATKASIGFAAFKEYWGTDLVPESARMALAWWFNELKISRLFGAILATNKLARSFAKKIGFTEIGIVPEFSTHGEYLRDTAFVTIGQDEYNKLHGRQLP